MVGVLDEIKAILSPAGAWLWAELGNTLKINVFEKSILFCKYLGSSDLYGILCGGQLLSCELKFQVS